MFDTPHRYDWLEDKWLPVVLDAPCDHSLLAPNVDRCALCGKSGLDIYIERRKGLVL